MTHDRPRRRRILAVLARWPATIAVALGILATSHIPQGDLPDEPPFPHFDKLVHLVQYGLLGFLLVRSIRHDCAENPRRAAIITIVVGTLFGQADEVHQSLAGRTADAWDLAADVVGLACGVAVAALVSRIKRENASDGN
jgi:VanZ family protein